MKLLTKESVKDHVYQIPIAASKQVFSLPGKDKAESHEDSHQLDLEISSSPPPSLPEMCRCECNNRL